MQLAKQVPQQLDSVLALCLIKGMSDENKKADISYIVHSQPKITFREVVEVLKAKHRGIGKADPFATIYIGRGRYKCRSDYQGASGNSGQVPYMIPSHGMNGPQAMIPVNTAAATRTVPSYHITRNPKSAANASPQKANVTTGGPLTTEHGIGGITEEQLLTIMDRYLQARGGIVTQGANTQQADFQQPAPPTPQVTTLVRGVLNPHALPNYPRGQGPQVVPSPRVTCFGCGQRGHYANTCQYPPLSPDEQEQLGENARMHWLQQAGLAIPGPGPAGFAGSATVQGMEETQDDRKDAQRGEPSRTTEIQEGQEEVILRTNVGVANQNRTSTPGRTTHPQPPSIGAACAVLSRVPPVMSILQKIMAEKQARMEAEEGLGEAGPRTMKTRRRTYMEIQGMETEERLGVQ